jgi:hypothetical protein
MNFSQNTALIWRCAGLYAHIMNVGFATIQEILKAAELLDIMPAFLKRKTFKTTAEMQIFKNQSKQKQRCSWMAFIQDMTEN